MVKSFFFFFYFGYPDLSFTTQIRFSNLTILNTHKQKTDKLCLVTIADEFVALNDNRKDNFGTSRESDLKMSGWRWTTSTVACVGLSFKVSSESFFGLTCGGQVVTCCFMCRWNNHKFILLMAVLDAFTIAISEDLNLKFSRGSMPPDPPSLITLTRQGHPTRR